MSHQVLHSDDPPGRHHRPERRPVPPGQAAGPAGFEGAADGAQGLRRPALPRLHQEVSGVGPAGQDDAELGAQVRAETNCVFNVALEIVL